MKKSRYVAQKTTDFADWLGAKIIAFEIFCGILLCMVLIQKYLYMITLG